MGARMVCLREKLEYKHLLGRDLSFVLFRRIYTLGTRADSQFIAVERMKEGEK